MTRMFIDGEWCDAAGGATVEATSPATGESLGQVAEGDRADARRAIAAANAAFPAWAARTGFERAELLHRVADACERRLDELAHILTLDQGKPLRAEARGRGRRAGRVLAHGGRGRQARAGDHPRERGAGPARAAAAPAARGAGADHALELALHDARRGARAGARMRQHGRLDAGALDRGLLGRAGGVRRRGRPAAGRLQHGARPGPRGRRRARREPGHARRSRSRARPRPG